MFKRKKWASWGGTKDLGRRFDCVAEVRRQLADGKVKNPSSHHKTATPDSIIYGNAS